MMKLTSPCEHDVLDYVWNGTHFVCMVKVYDKGTVEECGARLESKPLQNGTSLRDYTREIETFETETN